MKVLIAATSHKPANFVEELRAGQRYRIEYIELSEQLPASYIDYDQPGIHDRELVRRLEEKIHVDFFWARQIARKVKQEKFDLVLSMSERIGVPLGVMLDPGVKHIVFLHSSMAPKWLAAIKLLHLQKRWTQILVFSQAEARALSKELQVGPEKVTWLPTFVDVKFFRPDGLSVQEEPQPFIMSQGLAKRDYPTLIRAMQTIPHVSCRISAVSAWDKFKAGYEGMDIPSNVELKAYNHPAVIKQAIRQSRFIVIPLRTDTGVWCAGLSSVLQAQSMGRPVIVTHLPGIAEYVKHGETGYLVKGNDPQAMAEVIDQLWRDPRRAEEMGREAQRWIHECFSLDVWLERLSALVRKTAEADVPQETPSNVDITRTNELHL